MKPPSIESLESRELYSVSAIAWGDTLYVGGDNNNNGISVKLSDDGSQLQVREYIAGDYQTIYTTNSASINTIKVQGYGGNDTLGISNDVTQTAYLFGGSGGDYLQLGGGVGYAYGNINGSGGGGDADTLVGGSGLSHLMGQSGNDTLFAGTGLTFAYGGTGNDTLWGSQTGTSHLQGNDGNDTFKAKAGKTSYDGGNGYDTVSYAHWVSNVTAVIDNAYSSGLSAGDKNHRIDFDVERVEGGAGDDVFVGSAGNDSFYGNGGNDLAIGGSGDDILLGGAGNDILWGNFGNDYLAGGEGNDDMYGHAGNDTLLGADGDDYMVGGDDDDVLLGGNGDDYMWGSDGDDTMYGNAGDDYMHGGEGDDLMVGNTGSDFLDATDGSTGDEVWGGDLGGGGDNQGDHDTAWLDEVSTVIPPGWTIWMQEAGFDLEDVIFFPSTI